MKKLIILILILLPGFCPVFAQGYFDKAGKISQAEADMTSCSFDPKADAVVLFDVGESSFIRSEEGFDVLYRRITRIKILNEAGKKYAEVSIPYYKEGNISEKVTIERAATYNKSDGVGLKITILDPKACYDEKETKNWRLKKFAMPDVKPGSIIEYVYTISSQYHFNLRDWEFQWEIPVLYSFYETRMIPFYEYTWLLQGRQKLDEYETYVDEMSLKKQFNSISFNDVVYKFGLKNVPAFNDEEFIPSREDYIIKINFQLSAVFPSTGGKINIMTTWPQLVSDYLKNDDFGKYVKKSGKNSSAVLSQDSLTVKTQLQKFNYIVNYAKDNFKWNQENSQFSDKSPSDLLKDKIGNSADINLWVVGAMQEAGLEAYPIVLSTRRHGKIISDFPFSDAFNTVAVFAYIDSKPVLTDATDPLCQNYRLPIQYMNDKGLVIDKGDPKWVSLQSPAISKLTTNIKIDSIGLNQTATVLNIATEYEALSMRNKYAGDPKKFNDYLSENEYQIEEGSLVEKNSYDREKPYFYSYKLKNKTEVVNGKIYIQPFLHETFSDNPLKQKTRTYPVDLTYPVRRTYLAEIVVPEGYIVQYLPEKSMLDDELFDLEYTAVQNDNRVNVSFTYTFKNSVYPPEVYPRVKTMFDRIVKKGSEKIVLVRK